MATARKVERRPAHETVVDYIRLASERELYNLAVFIKATLIPKNHDVIILAWQKKLNFLGRQDTYGVTASLEEQKKEAEEGAKARERVADAMMS